MEFNKLIPELGVGDFGKPKKTFVLRVLAGLIFLLIKDENIDTAIIDKEYPGHEATIKFILLTLFQKFKKPIPNIYFREIGKKSMAHIKGIAVFRGQNKPDIMATAKELLEIFYNKKTPLSR